MMRFLCCSLISFSAAALLHGQKQQPVPNTTPPAQTKPASEPEISELKQPEGTPAAVDPKTYRIGPEDVLAVVVWKEPELSGPLVVRPDGVITVNLIGEIQVNGLTPLELQNKLKAEYAKLVNNPIVAVYVQAVRSKKYYISGNVGRNGVFPLIVPITVLEALTMAGGPTEWANKKKIVIMRGDKRLYFNWKEVIEGKNLSQNIYVENGDFIIVK